MRTKSILATAGIVAILAGAGGLVSAHAEGHGSDHAGWGHAGWGGGKHGRGDRHGAGPFGGMMKGGMIGRLCPGSMPDPSEMEASLKADGIAWESLASKRDACFLRFDTDKDGTIGAAEIDAAVTVRANALANRALSFGDRDFDGSITRDEITGGWFGWRHWFGGGRRDDKRQPTAEPATTPGTQQPDAGAGSEARADDDMMPDMPRRGRGRGKMLGQMFDRADTDKNGTITDTELKSFARLLVDDGKRLLMHRLDKDKSGTLTRVEFDQPARDLFDSFDVNADGKVKRDELPLAMQWRLEG